MFRHTLRTLGRIQGTTKISIKITSDEDGYLDRKCPSDECGAEFKILFEDWLNKELDDGAYCPICRQHAGGTAWLTPEQHPYAQKAAKAYYARQIGAAIRADAADFNSRQSRGSFIKMRMEYRPGSPFISVPPDVNALMRQRYECEECGCRYASIGAAFFCPACGHDSVEKAFEATVEAAAKMASGIDTLVEAMSASVGPDVAEDIRRLALENGLVKLVSAMEHLTEKLFERLPNASDVKRRKNLFQSLPDGSALWKELAGTGYEDMLSPDELSELTRHFQQRHILTHKDGIVDNEYLTKSGDGSYVVGQRVVIRSESVVRLADLVRKLAEGLRRLCRSEC